MHRLPPPPALPRPPARIRFPVIAVIAPLIGAVVIGLVTGSPFILVFALLSPIIAIATVLDGRRAARRERRDEAQRFDRECRAYAAAIERAHAAERAEVDARHPIAVTTSVDERRPLRLGTAPAPSSAAPDEVLLPGDSADEHRLRALIARARRHDGLPVLVPRGSVAVQGSGLAADALVRRLEAETGVCVVRVSEGENPAQEAVVVRVLSATTIAVTTPDGRSLVATPEYIGRRQLAVARARHASGQRREPPRSVRWSEVHPINEAGGEGAPAGVPIGLDESGVVVLDLERGGPHALVGGTTGSGKSEFLRALALGWAASRSPSEVTLLLVDFKGGATFAGLTELPHTVGLVTDLDPIVAERALLSLRAELRRRERALAEAGVRDIAQQPDLLARLVVLVDEFAALIDAFPDLHAPFADLSARGRSLGVHLVLCTQNPAGAVRDAVAANCAVRIAFRLSASAGAGFIGAEGRELAAAPAGRAVIVTAEGARSVQIATIDDADIAAVRRRWEGEAPARSTWLPPLPTLLDAPDLDLLRREPGRSASDVARPPSPSGAHASPLPALAFGLLDDPGEQRRLPALWDPQRDGALAIVGAPRSGRTTALAALAEGALRAACPLAVLPGTLTEAWALLDRLAEKPLEAGLLLADDLDVLIADAADLAPELLSRWDAAVRAQRRVGGGAAAAIGPASGARALLGARFESRLLLRCLDVDDHQTAGAPRGLFDRGAPPGRGWWTDLQVQVVAASSDVLSPTRCPAEPWQPDPGRDVLVVTRRVSAMAAAVQAAHPEFRIVLDPAGEPLPGVAGASPVVLEPRILIADPETWQSAWAAFTGLRRAATVVVVRADPADLRVLLGHRTTPPPLDEAAGDAWVVEPGEPVRRRGWITPAAG